MRRSFFIASVVVSAVGIAAAAELGLQQAAPGPAAPTASADPAIVHLRSEFEALLRRADRTDEEWGVLVVSLDRGDTLIARAPYRPLAPASNMKIFTTAAALLHLGAEFRYHTFLLTHGPIRHGVLAGDVILYGTGDPTLGRRFEERPAPALEAFADTLEALGVREIRGDIVGDGSYFRGPGTGLGWDRTYLNAWYAAPAGALSVHENLVRLRITPGDAPGWRPAVDFLPGGRGIAIVNLAQTGGGARIQARRLDYDGPILLVGRIGGGTASDAVPVADPARFAAAVFRDLLEERGIRVTGEARAIDDAADSPVTGRRVFAPALERRDPSARLRAFHASEPLREILHVINHQSHNFYSEQVLRTVGRIAAGEGSVEGGSRVIRALVERAGADTTGLRVFDGCGLSPHNRASAAQFIAVLEFMWRSGWAAEFVATLPVAGEAPRFRRMGGTPAEGNLRAKTGTIDGVSALSGYVAAADGERLAFSFLGNNLPTTSAGKYLENLMGADLAAFRRGSPPAPAGPGAPPPDPAGARVDQ